MAAGMASRLQKVGSILPKGPKIPDKLKGGRLERIGLFFKAIMEDYKMVAQETAQDIKDRPIKSALIFSCLGMMGYMFRTNPGEANFKEQLTLWTNEVQTVGEPIRNPTAVSHLQRLAEYYNHGTLRKLNVGLCTVLWRADFDKGVNMYEAHCKHLRPRFREIKERIVDIGIFGRWLMLEKAMVDYDINPNEWQTSSS